MPVEQLEVEDLHLWRGERLVLRGLRFALALGVCLEVCGANGSGMTTLLRTLSAGQRRRVALAGLALLHVPLWLLDEPTTNLDGEGRELVGTLLSEHLGRGGMVIAAVHQGLPASVSPVTRLELAA